MDHLVFYPDSVTYNHLGSIFLGLSASLILAALALATFCRGRRLYDSDNPIPVATSMVFLGACVLAPLIILTIDVSKSPIVGGVVGVPCAVVTVVGLAVLARRAFTTSRVFDIPYYAWAAMAVVSVLVGGWNYFSHLTSRGPFHFRQQEIAQLNQIYDSIARYTETAGWNYPALSMNTVSEAINGDVIVVSHFERTGRLVRIRKLFGHGIFAVSRQKVFEDLPKSDLLILQDLSGESLANHPYPFYASLRGFSDEIRQWADHHLAMLIETPSIYGAGFKVYVRPSMGILELSAGGSIPRKEIWLSGDGRIIRQYPLVILEASEDRSIPPTTKLKAESYTNDGKPVIIPTDFALEGRKRIIRLDFRNAVRFLGPTVMTKLMLDFEDTNYEPRHIAGHAANALLGFNRVRMESPD